MAAYTLPEGFSDFDMFAFGSALLVGGLLGFFLNAISILAYISVKQMRTPSNFLVFNLAVADIMLNLNGLIAAYASLFYRHWPWGQDGCSNHAFMGMTAVLASISFLATIAWDRYHQYVTSQKLFWSTAWTISIIIWGLAIIWAAVPLIGWGVYDFEPMRTCCTLDYTKGDMDYITYMGALTVFYLIFPAYVMKSNYDAIHAYFKKIHKHRWNTSIPLRVLLFCWGPYEIMCIYACFGNARLVSPKLRMLLPVLAKTNPIFNAWLYSFGNEFYRGGVWQFLTGQKFTEPVVVKLKGR
ncbi:RPE-retinal G protein-coupled receptor [Oncorhynchus tshawytscha]|nr:RPE-retinal G protein-coupled receptor [Oncorhynchus tshawytscha]